MHISKEIHCNKMIMNSVKWYTSNLHRFIYIHRGKPMGLSIETGYCFPERLKISAFR